MIRLLAVRMTFLLLSIFLPLPILAEPTSEEPFIQSRLLTTSERKAVEENISLINLIATPEKYSGKLVAVEGYLHLQFEDERLYLSQTDAERLITANALDVSFAKSNLLLESSHKKVLPHDRDRALYTFDKKYVMLTGKFSPGSLSEVSRVLENVTYGMGLNNRSNAGAHY